MSAPRNRPLFEAAQADREKIRAVLATRGQDEPLFTPKDLLRILGWPDTKLRTMQRHLDAIREPG